MGEVFRSTCKACVAAGVDEELATIEHDNAEDHAKAFNEHLEKKHRPAKPGQELSYRPPRLNAKRKPASQQPRRKK